MVDHFTYLIICHYISMVIPKSSHTTRSPGTIGPSGSPPVGQARVDRLQVDPVGLSSEMAKPSECGKTMCEWDMLYML